MAFMEFSYYSRALMKTVNVNVLLPEIDQHIPNAPAGIPDVESYKTLYLLHGLTGDYTHWIKRSNIEQYAHKYGIAVVMPDAARSWYTDTMYEAKYFTFITEELPQVCRGYFKKMSEKREDNFVAGLSMGGYGALKIALTYPERYFACAYLSAALDITRKNRDTESIMEWRALFGYDLNSPAELANSCHDVFNLARKCKEEGKEFPKMYAWCGTDDFWVGPNREFRDHLEALGVEQCYNESEGDHTWPYWDKYIQTALKYILEGK